MRTRVCIATLAFVVLAPSSLGAQEDPDRDLVPRVVSLVARTSRFGALTSESARKVEIVASADAIFRFGTRNFTPRARRTLADAAEQIQSKAVGLVRIEGHTDAKGLDAYNETLSGRRATAVKLALAGLLPRGISMRTFAYGARRPIAPNTKPNGTDNPKGRAENRRIVIEFRK